MAVIAVTSGMGTGVKYVAEHVARCLGLELVHREIGEAGRAVAPNTHHTLHESQRSRWDAGLAWLTPRAIWVAWTSWRACAGWRNAAMC